MSRASPWTPSASRTAAPKRSSPTLPTSRTATPRRWSATPVLATAPPVESAASPTSISPPGTIAAGPSRRGITSRQTCPATTTSCIAPKLATRSDRGEQAPRPRRARELALAAFLEVEARAGEEVADRARDEDFARTGGGRDPGADADGGAVRVGAHALDLAAVDARARVAARDDRRGAADGARRPVEAREHADAAVLQLAAA